jgi:hypothetical protein
MHGERVYFSEQNLNSEPQAHIEGTNTHFQASFKNFLSELNRENSRIYHRQISHQIQKNKYILPL